MLDFLKDFWQYMKLERWLLLPVIAVLLILVY